MSDFRDLLDQERRRFRMSDGSFRNLERRRDRKRRNRRIASGLLALLIAVAGVGGGLYAVRLAGSARPIGPSPTANPSGVVVPTPTESVTPNPTPSTTAPVEPIGLPAVAGPIQFIDDQHGWAVFNGHLVATSDGGVSWQPLNTGSQGVGAIDFTDLQHGWAVGQSEILQTVDGGASWTMVSDQAFAAVDFVDAQTGWAVRSDSQPGELVKTDDGGRTWTGEGHAESVCAADGQHAWAAGLTGEGAVSVSRWDASQASWIETALPVPTSEPWTVTIRCSMDGQEAFVLLTGSGAAGHVAYVAFEVTAGSGTADDVHPVLVASFAAGELGVDAYQDDDPYPGVLTVVDSGVAYFLNWCPACEGQWASFVKTEGDPAAVTDRIAISPDGSPAPPVGISFVDAENGWVLFYSGMLLQTEDGGRTWFDPCQGQSSSGCFGIQSVP